MRFKKKRAKWDRKQNLGTEREGRNPQDWAGIHIVGTKTHEMRTKTYEMGTKTHEMGQKLSKCEKALTRSREGQTNYNKTPFNSTQKTHQCNVQIAKTTRDWNALKALRSDVVFVECSLEGVAAAVESDASDQPE